MRKATPEFEFTSVQLSYNYASRLHVDRNNVGSSYVIGLGNYVGGNIWVHDKEGDTRMTIDNGTHTSPRITGMVLSTQGKA